MKLIFYSSGILFVLLFSFQESRAQANTALSNLAATAVNADLVPGTDNTRILGSATKGWKQLYINNAVFLGGSKFISYGNTLGLGITAVGNNALAANTGGFANTGIGFYSLAANTNGNANAAIGTRSLQANTTGSANMAMGYFSLFSNTTGFSNVAIGVRAMLTSAAGHNQVAIGDSALFTMNGGAGFNTAIGSKAMYLNTTGDHNTAIGFRSLYANTTGIENAAIGTYALNANTTGKDNAAIGHGALFLNTTGSRNTAMGSFALDNNTTGMENAAIGFKALYNNTGDFNTSMGSSSMLANTTGVDNTATGAYSLSDNTTGVNNASFGYISLTHNTTGGNNTATGAYALQSNIDGNYNVANGTAALSSHSTGNENTAVGNNALHNDISGGSNTAMGSQSLYSSTTGSSNVAMGDYSLNANTDGTGNTGIGSGALGIPQTGNFNTAVGYGANVGGEFSNATAVGHNAYVTADNTIRVGDGSVTSIGGQVLWTTISDGRFKTNIKENVVGLEFIKKLRPVTYNFDPAGFRKFTESVIKRPGDKNTMGATRDENSAADAVSAKILYTGFVAQEVETAAKSLNYDFSGVDAPKNEKDYYGLRYASFVVPLVKGMQELSDSNDTKSVVIRSQQIQIDSLNVKLQRLEDLLQQLIKGSSSNGITLSDASLGQNSPNPFAGSTLINYNIPQNFGRSRLEVSDMSGHIIKTVSINSSGRGNLSIDASGLSSGVYNYTLYVDEKMVSTKQMVLTK